MEDTLYQFIAGIMRYVFILLIWLILIVTARSAWKEYRLQRRYMGKRVVIGYLERRGPDGALERYPLGMDALIGSGRGCDVRIRNEGLERRQAQISCRDDGVFLLDLSKGDPPEINGVGAPERVQLLNGDQIRFGEVTFRLRLEVERDA